MHILAVVDSCMHGTPRMMPQLGLQQLIMTAGWICLGTIYSVLLVK